MSTYVGFKIGKAEKRKAYISEYYCGRCGYPVSDHDSYCPECGGAFRKENAIERMYQKVRVSIIGCDDWIEFDIACTTDNIKFLQELSKKSKSTSTYGCMPTIEFEVVNDDN